MGTRRRDTETSDGAACLVAFSLIGGVNAPLPSQAADVQV